MDILEKLLLKKQLSFICINLSVRVVAFFYMIKTIIDVNKYTVVFVFESYITEIIFNMFSMQLCMFSVLNNGY